MCDPLRSRGLQPARLLRPWNFPGKWKEWVALSFSRGSSQPGNWTQFSRTAGRCFTLRATREARERRETKRKTKYLKPLSPGTLPLSGAADSEQMSSLTLGRDRRHEEGQPGERPECGRHARAAIVQQWCTPGREGPRADLSLSVGLSSAWDSRGHQASVSGCWLRCVARAGGCRRVGAAGVRGALKRTWPRCCWVSGEVRWGSRLCMDLTWRRSRWHLEASALREEAGPGMTGWGATVCRLLVGPGAGWGFWELRPCRPWTQEVGRKQLVRSGDPGAGAGQPARNLLHEEPPAVLQLRQNPSPKNSDLVRHRWPRQEWLQ